MNPIDATVPVGQLLGSAGLIVALVAAINKAGELPARASLFVGAACALVVTVIWEYGTAQGAPIDWASVPLQALIGWLTAMGTWTGGKVAIKGTAGGEPKP